MSDTFLTPAHIHPRIDILGNSQYFNFYDQFNSFVLFNRFAPTSLLNTGTNLDFTNTNFSGFRFRHITDVASNAGTFSLNYFQFDDNVGTPLFTANTDNIFFNVYARGNAPLVNNDYTNKFYVDSLVNNLPNQIILQGDIIGNGLVGQSINTSFQKTLNQISNNGNINIGNFLLNNVATPTIATDGANRGYVDNKTWMSTQITDFNTAVRSNSLNQFAVPTADLSMNNFKITNLNDPVNNKDAINLSYLQSYVSANKGTGTVTSITAGTGLSGGTITGSGTIALANISGFLAGVYNWPNSLTINQQGQVIGANSGVQPITSIISNSGLTVNTSGGQALVNIFDTGVTPGTYTWPAGFSVNSMGQLTFVTSSGSFPINRLAGYPANSSLFLRGDGTWSSQSTPIIDINNGTTGQLNISRLQNYPFNSGVFLRGDGVWANAVTQFPVTVNTSSSSMEVITTYNSNSSAYKTGIGFYNQNNNQGVQFGFNNSTNEGYIWALGSALIKFGTNSTIRARILNDGTFDLLNNNFITTGDISSSGYIRTDALGSLSGNNIAMQNPVWMNGLKIKSLAFPTDYWDAANKGYVDSLVGSEGLSAAEINVNTSGGNTNWLRRSNITRAGVQIYGLNSSAQILENTTGESAGIGYDGSTDACTIWTAGDSGSYLNIQDEDISNARCAYVAINGAWAQVSSAKRKHSIKEKNNNNVLDRFLKLSIKSYGYKYDIEDKFSDRKKERMKKKQNKMSIGLILEELFDVFPNCIPDYYNKLFQEKDFSKKVNLEEEITNITNCGIDYNTLLCYFIMAFQEFVQQTNNNILELRGKK